MMSSPLRGASQPSQTKLEKKLEEPSSRSNFYTSNKYDGKNAKSRTTMQLGVDMLQYKKFTLEPYMEIKNVVNTNRLPWHNTLEVNQGIRLKRGEWQFGLKNVYGFYLPHAKNADASYQELQSYSSIWHNWRKQNLIGEEWAKLCYHGPSSRKNSNNMVFRGAAEAGVILAEQKSYLIEPFYKVALTLDTKKLPWNNKIENSAGIKLRHKKWQLGVKAFNKSYLLGKSRDEQSNGIMLFLKFGAGEQHFNNR